MLLPASLQDWLPNGHLAYFISDTVDALDRKAFYARYAGGGSRKIQRRLHEDLAFRMLGAGNVPEHRTIGDFRALHLKELSDLFVQVVKLAREMGWNEPRPPTRPMRR
jgi:transposase